MLRRKRQNIRSGHCCSGCGFLAWRFGSRSFICDHVQKEDLIGISARSNGEFNVQVVMEQMGGGGHLSNAAAQISGKTIADVHEELLTIIENVRENQE